MPRSSIADTPESLTRKLPCCWVLSSAIPALLISLGLLVTLTIIGCDVRGGRLSRSDGDGDDNSGDGDDNSGDSDSNDEADIGDDDSETEDPATHPDLPDTSHCAEVSDWPPDWAEAEDEVLALTNLARGQGAVCGSESFGPTGPLTGNGALRCAARLHSWDMAERNYFDHTSPDGDGPAERVDAAGYPWMIVGENIALGSTSPEDVVNGWLTSPGHCANIMEPSFEELGVGYDPSGAIGQLWTQNFGTQ